MNIADIATESQIDGRRVTADSFYYAPVDSDYIARAVAHFQRAQATGAADIHPPGCGPKFEALWSYCSNWYSRQAPTITIEVPHR